MLLNEPKQRAHPGPCKHLHIHLFERPVGMKAQRRTELLINPYSERRKVATSLNRVERPGGWWGNQLKQMCQMYFSTSKKLRITY